MGVIANFFNRIKGKNKDLNVKKYKLDDFICSLFFRRAKP